MSLSIPTFRPRLPSAEALAPLLREIDENRWYSNFGPLVQRFESQLAKYFRTTDRRVVTVANATAGIALALQEVARGNHGLCMMPAWTHIAPAIATINAGLTPWFVDVDPKTWQLTPAKAMRYLSASAERPQAIIVVSPFGGVVDTAGWSAFSVEADIPVVVDAAAAFDAVRPEKSLLQVVSLHATKVLGVGEGGFILTGDDHAGERLHRMSNFGLDRNRISIMPGSNAKMSEYAAAVGLVALEMWPLMRAGLASTARRFLDALSHIPEVLPAPNFNGTCVTNTGNVVLPTRCADAVIRRLLSRGIGARKWWPTGCHRHPILAHYPHEDLPVTEELSDRVIGLPFFPDITDEQINFVMTHLAASVEVQPIE